MHSVWCVNHTNHMQLYTILISDLGIFMYKLVNLGLETFQLFSNFY